MQNLFLSVFLADGVLAQPPGGGRPPGGAASTFLLISKSKKSNLMQFGKVCFYLIVLQPPQLVRIAQT